MTDLETRILDAALMHVPFDGWSETSFRAALDDADVTEAEGRAIFKRGAVDLALAFHRRGDAQMRAALDATDLKALRYRDRVALAVRKRLELVAEHKEAVRRGATLFSLPIHAADGARALWGTADAIWLALGDTSDDLNWYTKRVTLSGVYSSTVLYWLGDQTPDHAATWAFLDRRIDDVMRIESMKKAVRDNRLLRPLTDGIDWVSSRIKAPSSRAPADLPGSWTPPG